MGISLVVTTGCSVDRLLGTCQGKEEKAFPAVEQVAEQTMAGVGSFLERYSVCEDTGEPDASVIATVRSWQHRRIANEHLVSLGWAKDSFPSYVSADGRWRANVVMSQDADDISYHVEIRFGANTHGR